AAVLLAVAARPAAAEVPNSAPLADGGTARIVVSGGVLDLTVTEAGTSTTTKITQHAPVDRRGADTRWQLSDDRTQQGRPASIDADTLLRLNGGRLPVGFDLKQAPGPYQARWTEHRSVILLTRDGGIVDGSQTARTLVVLTGGGLSSPRVVQINADDAGGGWQLSPGHRDATVAMINNASAAIGESMLWRVWLPIVLAIGGLLTLARGVRSQRRLRAERPPAPTQPAVQQAGRPS
ncbi:MAG: hypothetical protein J2P23_12185, partial [Microlunatus sp.]|nr:hypothetical protein [Microlunatus sp.]